MSGTNVSTDPTPAMMPSVTSETIQSATPAATSESFAKFKNSSLMSTSSSSAMG